MEFTRLTVIIKELAKMPSKTDSVLLVHISTFADKISLAWNPKYQKIPL